MTSSKFEDLSVERDRDLGRGLYHHGSLIRLTFRNWIVEEIKELKNELDERITKSTSTVERTRLGKIREKLEEFDNTKRQEAMEETTPALENANNSVWTRVDEPCVTVFDELQLLAKYVAELAELRVDM